MSNQEDDSFVSLGTTYANLLIEKSNSQPIDKAIRDLTAGKDFIFKNGSVKNSAVLHGTIAQQIAKLCWNQGLELESEQDFDNAYDWYIRCRDQKIPAYSRRGELRALICRVKMGNVDSELEDRIKKALEFKSFDALKEDLAYRYTIYLISSVRPSDAEGVLKNSLPDDNTLADYLKVAYNTYFDNIVLKLNFFVEKAESKTLSLEESLEAWELTNKLRETNDKTKLPLVEKYWKYFVYKTIGFWMSSDIQKAFDWYYRMDTGYMDDDVALRNMAILSMLLLEQADSSEFYVKLAIPIFLTAVYIDKLFVQSLDQTTWDDNFTFSLDNSLGQTCWDDYDNLPDNVNFNRAVDNQNISIRETQEYLLNRFEKAILANFPSFENMYRQEKEAIETLLNLNLDKPFIVSAPSVSFSNEAIYKQIRDALIYEYSCHYDNDEDVLRCGVMYHMPNVFVKCHNEEEEAPFFHYEQAQAACEKCIKALETVNTGKSNSIKLSAICGSVDIHKYPKLLSNLTSHVSNTLNSLIQKEFDFKLLLDCFHDICSQIDNDSLSYLLTNYVNGEVVELLNNDQMELRDGVGYMVRIYKLTPGNVRIKQNLEGILSNLAAQAATSNSYADKTALQQADAATGGQFSAAIKEAQIQGQLNDLIDKVNSGRVKKYSALQTVYTLYTQNPNDERLCTNLVTLCEVCVFEYIIKDISGSATVCSILDKLNRNKSATFKRCSSSLAKTYREFMSSLPNNIKGLIAPEEYPGAAIEAIGSSLNHSGYCLKKGLEYLKSLSGYTPSRRGGLFGNDLPF